MNMHTTTLLKPERKGRRAYTQKATNHLKKKKRKNMTVACSIFTLGGQVELFWTAFDMPATGVPLKVASGYKKIVFGCFKK